MAIQQVIMMEQLSYRIASSIGSNVAINTAQWSV